MASPLSHLLHVDPDPSLPSHRRPAIPTNAISGIGSPPGPAPGPANASLLAPPVTLPSASALPVPSQASTPATLATAAPQPAPAVRGHASNSSLYQCADCLRRYSRPEHLQRHITSHTLGKRFTCDVCGKAFGRADLLKRHRANHEDEANGTKKRRVSCQPSSSRVGQACQACAKARVKCEEEKPCARCRKRNLVCEPTSTEAGSAAAMHLLHLSGAAHASNDSSPATTPIKQDPGYDADISAYHPDQPVHVADEKQGFTHVLPSLGHVAVVTSITGNMVPEEPQMLGDARDSIPRTIDQGHPPNFQTPFQNHGQMVDMSKPPFFDFLRDVLYPPSLGAARLSEPNGLAVLDFCDNGNLELDDVDFGLLGHWNVDTSSQNMADYTPQTEDSPDISKMRQNLVRIWTESPWWWMPNETDNAYGEQSNLPIASRDADSQRFQASRQGTDKVVPDKLESPGRDKILAIVLSTCRNNSMMTRVASSFPSVDFVDSLIHIFLLQHLCTVSSWIHFGSFVLNEQWPEWLAMAASVGAVLTPVQTLRKFGYALQEAVRVTIPARFEDNNTSIQDIGLVQSLVLWQDIGLWSGNKRKMEIAEAHLGIPIAMMRYRNTFRRSFYDDISVNAGDQGDVLESKWKQWYKQESWKRLAFHIYLRDAQASMTSLTNPLLSYSEMTLPLPESRDLWFAKTAQKWKDQCMKRAATGPRRLPSLGDLLRDIELLRVHSSRLDLQFATSVYLHGFWSLIWEYRQLSSIVRAPSFSSGFPGGSTMLLASRHQELCRMLHAFQSITADCDEVICVHENIVLNLLLMNLHVSLDDLQLFSGKEGEDQARRIYPTLQLWSNSPEARQALWYAGQILRLAKLFPPGHLTDFYAICAHHAALALWTVGVVQRATRRQSLSLGEVVYLDGLDSDQVRRFVGFGHGRPTIRSPPGKNNDAGGGAGGGGAIVSYLEDSRSCMGVVQEILRSNFAEGRGCLSPIVENLCHLIKQLGDAAWAVGLS